jgi:hypothetical protein
MAASGESAAGRYLVLPKSLGLGLLGFLATSVDNLNVVIQYRRYHGNHVGFYHPGSDGFGASHPNIHNTLEGQVPFPHIHHILTAPLLEQAN